MAQPQQDTAGCNTQHPTTNTRFPPAVNPMYLQQQPSSLQSHTSPYSCHPQSHNQPPRNMNHTHNNATPADNSQHSTDTVNSHTRDAHTQNSHMYSCYAYSNKTPDSHTHYNSRTAYNSDTRNNNHTHSTSAQHGHSQNNANMHKIYHAHNRDLSNVHKYSHTQPPPPTGFPQTAGRIAGVSACSRHRPPPGLCNLPDPFHRRYSATPFLPLLSDPTASTSRRHPQRSSRSRSIGAPQQHGRIDRHTDADHTEDSCVYRSASTDNETSRSRGTCPGDRPNALPIRGSRAVTHKCNTVPLPSSTAASPCIDGGGCGDSGRHEGERDAMYRGTERDDLLLVTAEECGSETCRGCRRSSGGPDSTTSSGCGPRCSVCGGIEGRAGDNRGGECAFSQRTDELSQALNAFHEAKGIQRIRGSQRPETMESLEERWQGDKTGPSERRDIFAAANLFLPCSVLGMSGTEGGETQRLNGISSQHGGGVDKTHAMATTSPVPDSPPGGNYFHSPPVPPPCVSECRSEGLDEVGGVQRKHDPLQGPRCDHQFVSFSNVGRGHAADTTPTDGHLGGRDFDNSVSSVGYIVPPSQDSGTHCVRSHVPFPSFSMSSSLPLFAASLGVDSPSNNPCCLQATTQSQEALQLKAVYNATTVGLSVNNNSPVVTDMICSSDSTASNGMEITAATLGNLWDNRSWEQADRRWTEQADRRTRGSCMRNIPT
eukprot:GHVQ01008174.1.p1 GENE.GHVQ01008174.1~~GHVQ01008174.1.p1  ORF type:complete len:712 (+),score=122.45 GHVQ01008174.1:1510-3645(+)